MLRNSLMALILLISAGPALAQEGNFEVEAQILRVSNPNSPLAGVRYFDAADWGHQLRAGEAQVLETGTVVGNLNHDSLMLTGGKIPIAYPDPRTGSYQVQYVDTGLKLDVKAVDLKNGRLQLECRLARQTLTQDATPLAGSQDGFVTNSMFEMKPGQVAVLSATRGHINVPFLKRCYPNQPFSDSDTLIIAVSIRKF